VDRFQLIGAQKAELVCLEIGRTLVFILPAGLGGICRALRKGDVVIADLLVDEALRIRFELAVLADRSGVRERGDDAGVPMFQIPKVVQVAVREQDKAAVLRPCVLARLFLTDKRVLVL